MSESESTVLPIKLNAEELDITKIPEAMRQNGWVNGPILMDKWFSQTANNQPEKNPPSTDLIKMDWVLSFPRAEMVYRKLMQEQAWVNTPARTEIKAMLQRKNMLGDKPMKFGTPKIGLPFVDKYSTQYRLVGGYLDMAFGKIDDLRGALGNFKFKVIVIGEVEPIVNHKRMPIGKHRVTINEVGIYVWDSYDFNDDPGENQLLGNWDFDDNSAGRTLLNGGLTVRNSDFRDWREKTGMGGDYLIFSDIKYTKLSQPNIFEI